MKIELENNKVFFENKGLKKEIHPFWLRERVNNDEYLDKNTQQRKFDPTSLQTNVSIKQAKINKPAKNQKKDEVFIIADHMRHNYKKEIIQLFKVKNE